MFVKARFSRRKFDWRKSFGEIGRRASGGLLWLLCTAITAGQPFRPTAERPGADGAVQSGVEELPKGALARLGSIRFRSGKPLNRVTFSPDGKYIVVAGGDGHVNYWSVASGKVELSIPFAGGTITRLTFSPDGKYLAVAGMGGFVGVFDAATHQRLFLNVLKDNRYQAQAIAWCDAKSLVVSDGQGHVRILNPESGAEQKSFSVELNNIHSIVCSPDGKQLAAVASDGKLAAWTLEDGKESIKFEASDTGAAPVGSSPPPVRTPPDPPFNSVVRTTFRPAVQMAWSSDGKYIVAGSDSRGTPVWDAKTGKLAHHLPGTSYALSLAFFPNGRFLAAGAGTGQLRLFGLASGSELRVIDSPRDPTQDLAISPDGELIATVGHGATIRVLEVNTGRDRSALGGHKGAITGLAFLGDGKRLVSAGQDSSFIVWDAAKGKELERANHREFRVATLAPSPDGRGVVFTGATQQAMGWTPGTSEPRRLTLTAIGGYAPVVSTDGRFSAHPNASTIHLCDTETGKERARITSPRSYLNASQLAVSAHGRFVAATGSGSDRKVNLWSADGRPRPLFIDDQESFFPQHLVFSPDGRLLAGIAAGYLRVWETISGAARLRQSPTPGTWYTAATFTPDGQTLILGDKDGRVQLVDLVTGSGNEPIPAHLGDVRGFATSTDGKYLVSGGADTTVVVWDLPELLKRVPRRPIPAHVTPEQLDLWWSYLGSNDPPRAGEALWMLGHLPDQALKLFKERLRGVRGPEKEKIERWIKELDDERFAVRERAFKGLHAAGEEAKPFLDAALAGKPSEEVKRRVGQLLRNLTTGIPARKLQPLRAIMLLEKIDQPDVRPLLEEVAKQSTDEDVKQEIEWVLGRKKNQAEVKP